jgi:hypothetical protein
MIWMFTTNTPDKIMASWKENMPLGEPMMAME